MIYNLQQLNNLTNEEVKSLCGQNFRITFLKCRRLVPDDIEKEEADIEIVGYAVAYNSPNLPCEFTVKELGKDVECFIDFNIIKSMSSID